MSESSQPDRTSPTDSEQALSNQPLNETNAERKLRDLGFGSVVAAKSKARLLNRDGSFNVSREGVRLLDSLYLFDVFLSITWGKFLALVATLYLSLNILFALVYCALGEGALEGPAVHNFTERFLQALFFSFHTLSTAGYGNIVPSSLGANLVVAAESIAGMLTLALVTGMVFARFSRPSVSVEFSEVAVVAPYEGKRAFMFRLANRRRTQLIEIEARVVFSRMVNDDGRQVRRFYPLALERAKVMFFPLSWTIVHPIDETSPFDQLTGAECDASEAEVLVLITAIDETFSQTVHTRTSYKADEIVWNARFADIYKRPIEPGNMSIDIKKLHHFEMLDN